MDNRENPLNLVPRKKKKYIRSILIDIISFIILGQMNAI